VRVLVTGSEGFVGRWLVEHLRDQGDEVRGLDTEVDVTDPAALKEAVIGTAPDSICHLAARTSVADSWSSTRATYEVNTIGTANLLDAAASCRRLPRVLVVSSSEVYGRVLPEELPLAEDRPLAPVSPYAASKAAAEMVAIQAWLGKGMEVLRARPFNHTGPGQTNSFVVPALAEQVARALSTGADELRTGNLDARRDITDVRDVVRAYRLLLLKGEPGEVYNVCRGRSVSIKEVAERLLALTGVKLAIVVDPERVRPIDIPELRGDSSRIEAATGWRPQIELDSTLADVLADWQSKVV
jgi:GDP-4-dehydro-6-deoxy-D-mannose reductase